MESLHYDIWQCIFEACLPDYHERGLAAVVLPWRISHVCRNWRDMALSTPSLWCLITINRFLYAEGDVGSDRVKGHIQSLQLQLKRSKAYPLDIFLINRSGASSSPCPLWATLIPHLPRARILRAEDCQSNQLFLSARRALPESTVFPYLQHILWKKQSRRSNSPVFDLCQHSPRLRHLHFGGDIGDATIRLPFEQLQSVSLMNMNQTTLASIIPLLSNTEKLNVMNVSRRRSDDTRTTALKCTLPRLRTFSVGHVNDLISMEVESPNVIISAPNLHSFTILQLDGSEIEPALAFLRKTSCNLTTFVAENTSYMPPFVLESFLMPLPSLSLLKIHHSGSEWVYNAIDTLSRTSSDLLPVCPTLQTIRLGIKYGSAITAQYDVAPLMDMIRLRKVHGLVKVEIGVNHILDSNESESEEWYVAEDLLDEGIELRFLPAFPHLKPSLNNSFSSFTDVARDADLVALRVIISDV